jgi:dTDP-glucose 4,6-dehydratase
MPRILITGATGFIGSQLAGSLSAEGSEVYGLIREDSFAKNRVEGVRYVQGDLLDRQSIEKGLKEARPQVIVHLAARTPVRFSFSEPEKYVYDNYLGTCNLVESALSSKEELEQFVFASTGEVYGPLEWSKLLTEGTCPTPASPYAVSKYAAELYVRYAKLRGLKYTILRSTNTYGRAMELPEEARGYFVEKLILGMLSGEDDLKFDGFPESTRSFMHVSDHVAAYLAVIGNRRAYGQVFNVSTAVFHSLKHVAEKVRELTGYTGKIIWGASPRVIDPNFLNLRATKIWNNLRWKPGIDLDTGLKLTVDYWKKKKLSVEVSN